MLARIIVWLFVFVRFTPYRRCLSEWVKSLYFLTDLFDFKCQSFLLILIPIQIWCLLNGWKVMTWLYWFVIIRQSSMYNAHWKQRQLTDYSFFCSKWKTCLCQPSQWYIDEKLEWKCRNLKGRNHHIKDRGSGGSRIFQRNANHSARALTYYLA